MPTLELPRLVWSKTSQNWEWAAPWTRSPLSREKKSLFLGTTFHQRDFVLVALNPSEATDSHSLVIKSPILPRSQLCGLLGFLR